jgi:hypothetical protein
MRNHHEPSSGSRRGQGLNARVGVQWELSGEPILETAVESLAVLHVEVFERAAFERLL